MYLQEKQTEVDNWIKPLKDYPFGVTLLNLEGQVIAYNAKAKSIVPSLKRGETFLREVINGYPNQLGYFQGSLETGENSRAIGCLTTQAKVGDELYHCVSLEYTDLQHPSLHTGTNSVETGIWRWNARGNQFDCSPEVIELMGMEKTDVSYESYLSKIHEDDRPFVDSVIRRSLIEGNRFSFTHRLLPSNPRTTLETRLDTNVNAYGEVVHVFGTINDISEQSRAYDELLNKISMLNLMQQIATAANEGYQLQALLQFAIDRCCAATGWPLGTIKLLDEEKPSGYPLSVWYVDNTIFDDLREQVESIQIRKDKGIFGRVLSARRPVWVDSLHDSIDVPYLSGAQSANIQSACGFPIAVRENLVGLMCFFLNKQPSQELSSWIEALSHVASQVSQFLERKMAVDQLGEAELRYRELVESLNAIFWQGNPKTLNVNFVSKEAESILGYPVSQWTSESSFLANHIYEGDKANALLHLRMAARGAYNEVVYRMVTVDGRILWMRNIIRLLRKDHKDERLIGVMVDITAEREIEENLRNSREQLRALTARLQSVREEERIRISREIHDELGQLLTALKIDMTLFRSNLSMNNSSGQFLPEWGSMIGMVDSAIQSVQRIAWELRPVVLENLGLSEGFSWLAKDFETRTGISCSLAWESGPLFPNEECSIALYRIFQETLTNIARHAEAKNVEVKIGERLRMYYLSVEDDGKGIDANAIGDLRSLGLLGMRERAIVLGGEVTIEKKATKGTIVTVTLPRVEVIQ